MVGSMHRGGCRLSRARTEPHLVMLTGRALVDKGNSEGFITDLTAGLSGSTTCRAIGVNDLAIRLGFKKAATYPFRPPLADKT